MPKQRPTNFMKRWLTPATLVLVIGCAVSGVTALVLRQDALDQLRTEFELRVASVISYIQYEASRAYAVEITSDLNAMADAIQEQGIDSVFPQFAQYAAVDRTIVWAPYTETYQSVASLVPEANARSPHPLLDDFTDVSDESLIDASPLLPIERAHMATQLPFNMVGLELRSHEIMGHLLELSQEFRTPALYSRYSEGNQELDLPAMNLRFHVAPVFANESDGGTFLGFVGISSFAFMPAALASAPSPPVGIDMVSLENRETGGLRDYYLDSYPITGAARADRGSGPTEIVSIARPEFFSQDYLSRPWYTLGAGIFFSMLIAGYVRLSTLRTEQIEHIVAKRTMELSESNNHLQKEILERERTEDTLRKSEENYRLLAENITDIIWKADLHLHLTYVSPSCLGVFGFTPEETMARPWEAMFTPESLKDLAQATQRDREWSFTSGMPVPEHLLEIDLMHKEGYPIRCEIHFRMIIDENKQPTGYVGVTRDITQRKKQEADKALLEAQLFQARKMEAVGSLAGGVAHDFNNLLTGIMGYSTLLESRPDVSADVKRASSVISAAAERGRRLTQNLLGFARKGKFENKSVDFAAIVSEVALLLQQTTDPSIEIDYESDDESLIVFGDPDQLHLAVLNLIVNARDSLVDGGLIKLALRTEKQKSGSLLHFSVSDNGPGIAPEIRDRIFEPFFTTKDQNKGTGLGLATVYGIIDHHGGSIEVDSAVGEGATFTISLPLVGREAKAEADAPVAPAAGKGCVLVVDDDNDVRDAVSFILESLGYKVLIACDGQEALEIFREHNADIDVVLLDWRMPGMNGKECYQELRKIDPDVIAILTTGYGQEGMAQDLHGEGIHGFIRKPYRTQELAEVVANAMSIPAAVDD